jgi:hypothetical protein
MPDMSQTTLPRSDQLNADNFIGDATMTIKITSVDIRLGDAQGQKLVLHYEGEEGRPYKPCLGMRRLIEFAWGKETDAFIGRSMKIYNDPEVKFGGELTGGIRISHMSDIDRPMTFALSIAKAKRKAFTVRPLHVQLPPDRRQLEIDAEAAARAAGSGRQSFSDWLKTLPADDQRYLRADIGRFQRIASDAKKTE